MDNKCPYCGADTRPGDNFCLNCGNRLPSVMPPQQAQPGMSDATLAVEEDWAAGAAPGAAPAPGWSDAAAPTVADSKSEATSYQTEAAVSTMQATIDKIERPAHVILRSESGEVLQEYPLDKLEMSVGRAPNSDILLSKDKLTSRRHATIHYENGHYVLRDERSANGTFVNGQQLDEMKPYVLQDGDQIGIGEHELIFGSSGSAAPAVEDLPTISVPPELTYRTNSDENMTAASADDFGTKESIEVEPQEQPADQVEQVSNTPEPVAPPVPSTPAENVIPSTPEPVESVSKTPFPGNMDENVNLSHFTSASAPSLPDMTALMAALATLEGQVTSLQEQLNATQDHLRNYESGIASTTSQLRTGLRRVSERMDNTIADVARSREALAWAELLQLMEDVMNNPRDIEYVTKLARKARELNKVFQLHQNVLNTMAECNSLLRSMIGE